MPHLSIHLAAQEYIAYLQQNRAQSIDAMQAKSDGQMADSEVSNDSLQHVPQCFVKRRGA